jgi:hypothetical protein
MHITKKQKQIHAVQVASTLRSPMPPSADAHNISLLQDLSISLSLSLSLSLCAQSVTKTGEKREQGKKKGGKTKFK